MGPAPATLRELLLQELADHGQRLWPDGAPEWARPDRDVRGVPAERLESEHPATRRRLRLVLNTLTGEMLLPLMRGHAYTGLYQCDLAARIPAVNSQSTAVRANNRLLELAADCEAEGVDGFPGSVVESVVQVSDIVLADYNGWRHHPSTAADVASYVVAVYSYGTSGELAEPLRKILDGLR